MPRERFCLKPSENRKSKIVGDAHIAASNETISVLIKFKIRGNQRFLSHAEMVKVFQRACVRAGIKIQYSHGFNPRPKLSLPLPKSVGIEVDDDLLCLRVPCDPSEPRATNHDSRIKTRLSEQLPKGFELLTASVSKAKSLPEASEATYVLKVKPEYLNAKLKARIERLLASENVEFQRRDTKTSRFKIVDIRPFLKSIELDGGNIVVECKISSVGSIRVDEILKLLELDVENLAAPIRRMNVKWNLGL